MNMLTKEQIEECYTRSMEKDSLLYWASAPDIETWLSEFEKQDADLTISIIGDDFIKTSFDNWGNKEKVQMETIVDILANVLDL